MSDEKPVPETLETIAASIREVRDSINTLRVSMDEQFARVDGRFAQVDDRFTQMDGRLTQMDGEFVKIDGRLTKADDRFAKIDDRFDELKAQLRTEIEAVRGDVRLVAEALAAEHARARRNDADHRTFKRRLDRHDARIRALEPKSPRS